MRIPRWSPPETSFALVLLTALASVLFLGMSSTASWATHTPAPAPVLAPGQSLSPTAWGCHTTPADPSALPDPLPEQQSCDVTGWTVIPAESASATPLPVEVIGTASVREVAPAPPSTGGSSCPVPTDGAEPVCSVQATVVASQYEPMKFAAAVLIWFVSSAAVIGWRRNG